MSKTTTFSVSQRKKKSYFSAYECKCFNVEYWTFEFE